MKSQALFFLIALSSILNAQIKTVTPVDLIVAKKTIHFGFQTSFGLGIGGNKEIASSFMINPKVSYFIKDRLSLGLGYTGVRANFIPTKRPEMLHNAEVELKYFLVVKKPLLFYAQVGYLFGEAPLAKSNALFFNNHTLSSALKLGGGVSWRLKKLPNLTINMELNMYVSSKRNSRPNIQLAPDFSIGLGYFFKPHKKKMVKDLFEN